MNFSDINLTRLESVAPCYSTVPSTGVFKEKLYSGFKNTYKNPRNKETRVYSWVTFCGKEKWGQKTRQKPESEKTQVYAQKPRLKMLFKNSISGLSNTTPNQLRHLKMKITYTNSQCCGSGSGRIRIILSDPDRHSGYQFQANIYLFFISFRYTVKNPENSDTYQSTIWIWSASKRKFGSWSTSKRR